MMPDKSLLQTGRFTEYFNQLENLKNTKVDQYDKQFKLTSSSISIHDLIIEAEYKMCRGLESILCESDALDGYLKMIDKLKTKDYLSNCETFICSQTYYRICNLHLKLKFMIKAEIYFGYYETFHLSYLERLDEEIKHDESIKHSFVEISYSDIIDDPRSKNKEEGQPKSIENTSRISKSICKDLKIKREYIENQFNKRKAWFYHCIYQDEKALDILINIYKVEKKIKVNLKDINKQFELPYKYRINMRISNTLIMISEIYKKRYELK